LLVHPFLPDREVRIITDDVLVDMNFGTGAVKITPAHDPNDFQCGQRHGLPQINIFNDDGLINENGGRFEGQKRFEVRAALVEEMTAMGIFRGKAANKMTIGFCSRSKVPLPPTPSCFLRSFLSCSLASSPPDISPLLAHPLAPSSLPWTLSLLPNRHSRTQ
jgi:valyl-tRNA synthetase